MPSYIMILQIMRLRTAVSGSFELRSRPCGFEINSSRLAGVVAGIGLVAFEPWPG